MSIKIDLFPCFVSFLAGADPLPLEELRSAPPSPNSHQVSTARVVVTNTKIIVAIDGSDGPVIVMNDPYDPATLSKASNVSTTDSYLATASGTKVAFRKDENCGCGSRLRSWNAYSVMEA
jgi:hypothetical protein